MSVVFQVKRNFVEFEAETTDNKKHKLKFYELSTKQARLIAEAQGFSAILDANERVLRENIKGDGAKGFVEDLIENGNIDSFFETMNAELLQERENKRKNS